MAKSRKTVFKVMLALILGLIAFIYLEPWSMHPPFLEELGRVRHRMKIVASSAESYARAHSGRYPVALDGEFRVELERQLKPKQWKFIWTEDFAWLEILEACPTKIDAIDQAKRALGKNKVIFSPYEQNARVVGFFILGKDGHGALLNGAIRGAKQRPLVISPGDSDISY